ncbi:hypothetical protein [Brevundimonas sp. NIBR11]|uniref:hypothetical protein n=1 Tax=Brevundimonas sp. NIBR11 TaxID=3015999 RepID=UPI0022EFDAD7|nr:hypothetical protein [Brevundimonas sp. NIBR11]WGM31506.1 hypothetical protein KKHFBJBL_01753 [Brevundimonas sp. NIBR11]
MPQAIPAVIAAISYVGTATTAVVAGTATLAQIATVAAVGIGAGVGSMALSQALTPQIASQGAAVQWEANPDAPLRFAFGRVGVKGSIKDAAVYGPDRMYVSFACTVSAAGPIKSFVAFRAGDYYMSFNGAGMATTEPYAGEMWLSTRLGLQPDTALSLPSGLKNGATFPGWSSDRKLSGSAGYLITLGENSKRTAYDGKIPAFVATIEGLFCYDPRLDSTYPGGSGSCRLNNPATWIWTQNPILFGLKWALGLWEGPTGKGAPQIDYQVGGIGAKVEGIHLASFVAAANVSDANGWTSAAYPSTDDDKAQVLDGFLKAGGAMYAEIAGKIACIHRAAPRATVFTVTVRDTAGPVEIDTASSKLNRINTIRPRYWAEDQEWEMTALPEVTSTVWQEEDGQGVAVKRTRGADYTFVPQAKQARELASLEISNSREGIRGRVPLRPYMDPEPGNCFIFDEPDFALSNVKCFVLNVEDDTENDTVIVTFETETDGKYPFAYGQTGSPPPPQELDPIDPREVTPPAPLDWTVVVRPPAPGGGQLPGFDVAGVVNNATAHRVLVETGPGEDGPWTQAYSGPPTAERIQITVDPGVAYYVAVSYFNAAGNQSTRSVYGPYVAGNLVSDDTAGVGGTPAAELISFFREAQGLVAETDNAAETLIRETLDRHARVVAEKEARIADILDEETARIAAITAEQAARVAGLLAEAQARGEAIVGVSTTVTVVASALSAEVTTRTEQYAATVNSVALVDGRVTTVAGNLSAETATRLTQISAVNASIAGVDSRVTTSANDLASLTSSVTTQFSSVNGTLAEVVTLANTVSTGLAAETSTRALQISSVQGSIAGVDARVTTSANDLAALTTSVTSQFSTVNGTLSAHTTSITTNASAISAETTARTSQISSINGSLSEVITLANTVSTALAAETTTRSGQFSTLGTSIAGVDARVTTNATDLAALTSSVTSQFSSVNGNLSAVISLANTTATLNAALTQTVTDLTASTTAGLANVNTTLTALSDADQVLASSISTAQTTANGASASATFVLSALNGNQAYAALLTDVNGRFTGMRINGATQAVDFLAEYFNVTAGSGGGISYSAASKVFKIYDATSKTVLRASGDIRMWSGPASVADGSETAENGVLAIGPGVASGGRFNGQTLSGPFDSGAPGSGITDLTTTYQTLAYVERPMRDGGYVTLRVQGEASGNANPDGEGVRNWTIDYRLVSTALDGSDLETILTASFGGSHTGTISFVDAGLSSWDPSVTAKNGQRRLAWQARRASDGVTTAASVRNMRISGFYAG